ncbi:MAG: glycosyltransferase family 4 protein, partial [Thermoanaerobaculia bacterium]
MARPLHIALIYWDAFTTGGVQSQVAGRLDSLGAPGGPVRYTLFSSHVPAKNPWPHVRVEGFSGWPHVSIAVLEFTGALSLVKKLQRVHEADPFDLIELHAIGAGPRVVGWARRAGVPVLSVCHSLRFFSTKEHGHRWETALFYRWANRRTFLRSHRVLAVSRATRSELVEFGIPAEKIFVLHTAAPPPEPLEASARDPVKETLEIVFVGRPTRDKGLDVLVESLRILGKGASGRPVRLTVAGFVPEDSPIRSAVRSGAFPVTFSGSVANLAARALLGKADVVVIPSRYDPCPVVSIESLIEGALVVASRVGGIPEIIEDGKTGILVPPGDPEALAAALGRILDDPAAFSAIRQRAKEAGRAHTWAARGPQLLELYRGVLRDSCLSPNANPTPVPS